MAKRRKKVYPRRPFADRVDRHEVRVKMILAQQDRESAYAASVAHGATKPRDPEWECRIRVDKYGREHISPVFNRHARGQVPDEELKPPRTDDARDQDRAETRGLLVEKARKLLRNSGYRARRDSIRTFPAPRRVHRTPRGTRPNI